MKYLILLLSTSILITTDCKNVSSGQDAKATIEYQDLDLLIGEWTGSLTYLDYQTGNPYTMPANLIVEEGKNRNQLILKNIFPNESSANNTDKLTISKDRTLLNKQAIVSRIELPSGEIEVTTAYTGKDNNKKALIQHKHLLGKNSYSNTKSVQFDNSTEWIKRSEFSYSRKK